MPTGYLRGIDTVLFSSQTEKSPDLALTTQNIEWKSHFMSMRIRNYRLVEGMSSPITMNIFSKLQESYGRLFLFGFESSKMSFSN